MNLPIGVIHADDFMPSPHSAGCGPDKKNLPWEAGELIQRFNGCAMGDLCKHPCG